MMNTRLRCCVFLSELFPPEIYFLESDHSKSYVVGILSILNLSAMTARYMALNEVQFHSLFQYLLLFFFVCLLAFYCIF